MLKYFQDTAGEWRYQISGNNGKIMVTSEGYTRKLDAERGYWDLVNLLVDAHSTGGNIGIERNAHRASTIDAHRSGEVEES